MPLIGITGASGWVGGAVQGWLHARGISVRRLVREPRESGDERLDLGAADWQATWPKALEGCTAVVHCAANVHRPHETPAERERFHRFNVVGTERLVASCKSAGVGRFVLASSIAVYDWEQAAGARDENSTVKPATAYGSSKLEAEQIVRAQGDDWRIARLATVYGPGDRANFNRLAAGLRRGRFVIPGGGEARKSVVFIGDAGALLGRLALEDKAARVLLNLAAPDAPTLAEMCDVFSRVCRFPRARRVPSFVLGACALAGDVLQRLHLPAPISSSVLRKLTSDTVVRVERVQSLFPDMQWTSFTEGIERSRDYYANA